MLAFAFTSTGLGKRGTEAESAPIADEIPDCEVQKEVAKMNFPEIEGDMWPHAVVPKACQTIQKFVTKMDSVLAAFKSADQLRSLQQKSLDEFI